MGSSKQDQTVKVNKWLRPLAKQTAGGVQDWYNAPGTEYIGMSPTQRGYLEDVRGIAGQGQVSQPFMQNYSRILDPGYTEGEAIMGTPGFQDVLDIATRAAGRQSQSTATGGRRGLGGLSLQALQDARMNTAAQLTYGEQMQRRQEQNRMMAMSPMAQQMQYADTRTQMGVEDALQQEAIGERDWELQRAALANQGMGGNPFMGATTTSGRTPFDWGGFSAQLTDTALAALLGSQFGGE